MCSLLAVAVNRRLAQNTTPPNRRDASFVRCPAGDTPDAAGVPTAGPVPLVDR